MCDGIAYTQSKKVCDKFSLKGPSPPSLSGLTNNGPYLMYSFLPLTQKRRRRRGRMSADNRIDVIFYLSHFFVQNWALALSVRRDKRDLDEMFISNWPS